MLKSSIQKEKLKTAVLSKLNELVFAACLYRNEKKAGVGETNLGFRKKYLRNMSLFQCLQKIFRLTEFKRLYTFV